jgi:hypothetical protein
MSVKLVPQHAVFLWHFVQAMTSNLRFGMAFCVNIHLFCQFDRTPNAQNVVDKNWSFVLNAHFLPECGRPDRNYNLRNCEPNLLQECGLGFRFYVRVFFGLPAALRRSLISDHVAPIQELLHVHTPSSGCRECVLRLCFHQIFHGHLLDQLPVISTQVFGPARGVHRELCHQMLVLNVGQIGPPL